jgi:hypothetical protein
VNVFMQIAMKKRKEKRKEERLIEFKAKQVHD